MKDLLKHLGFIPKENTADIYYKSYNSWYSIEVDFDGQTIYFGGKIKIQGKDTQNITKPEDWVVLECVNRLLEKGYKPENISLEKVYPAGHGFSGRLDICVTREDGSEYLLIECKTYGKEFEKEFARMKKDGGQLFTYFKFSNKADVIMLYASEFKNWVVVPRSEIVKIEEDYRKGDVRDFYNIWDKKTYPNLVWENLPYNSATSKKFTKGQLKPLTEDVSDKLFHGFASILRKHSVSDKPNAFNKIFNLFLAKLYDEAKRDEDELDFHWRDDDNAVDFQVRLIDLHKKGLFDFLQKEIEGIDDSDFQAKTPEEIFEKKKKYLKFNNIFAIKDVLNDADFEENQRVLKEVVQLLENYQIRYPRKQQHLSNFFERLLTTGLKQEVGQYFTPPPITKFIIRSLPLPKMLEQEINNETPKLPAIIDYAAGSGHFITEALEEYQDIINNISTKGFYPKAIKAVDGWKADPYEWAKYYVYGIEKDYRLVKVAKVGCYFYWDGVAQIIHGDGLDSFVTSKTYKGLLSENVDDSSKAKFSIVVSNPPYSVNDCKDDLEYLGAQKDFTLYDSLSDKSKEIECLFVERTKHLLKEGGVASLILPSSILNNTGTQTKTREIILKYFDIIAIAELGWGTFMATNTKTVTLFLRRRANKLSEEWKKSVDLVLETCQDNTINGIDASVSKYVSYVWEGLSFDDYVTLMQKAPNEKVTEHELYREYRKKFKSKTEKDFWKVLLERESEKLFYFVIAYHQTVVLVKTGEKDEEKRFLGYEFSNRRGSEGMHAMQGGKTIDESTQLYNSHDLNDPTKASTYIYRAFENDVTSAIDSTIQNNVCRHSLIDMIRFDSVEFEKTISLSIKKKIQIESKWDLVNIGSVLLEQPKSKIQVNTAKDIKDGRYLFFTSWESILKFNDFLVDNENIYLSTGWNAVVKFYDGKAAYSTDTFVVKSNNDDKVKTKFIYYFLESILWLINEFYFKGIGLKHLQKSDFRNLQIPLPPLEIQEKIVSEIEALEIKEKVAREKVNSFKEEIISKVDNYSAQKNHLKKLGEIASFKRWPFGGSLKKEIFVEKGYKVYEQQHAIKNNFFIWRYFIDEKKFNEMKSFELLEGDLIMSCSGTIGKIAIFPKNAEKGIINQALLRFRSIENISLPGYLRICLSHITSKFEDNSHGTGLKNVASVEVLKNINVYCPPISEQQKIVTEIEKIESEISRLETELASIPAQKEAILKKYL